LLFSELGLCQEVLDGIRDMGFEKATEIQEKAIPILLKQSDILATSATGSGKTAAFALPMLHNLFLEKKKGIQALILAPTRELAQQIDEQFWILGYHTGISSATVYGGSDWSAQEKALKNGVNIVVATPGRLMDHMKISNYDFSNLQMLVLDEADRMLDMGFIPDVRSIINRLPKKRQSLLFSATMTPKIEALAKEFTNGKYERIKIGMPAPAKGINQVSYRVQDDLKPKLLLHLYETQKWHSAIVFASTKRGVEQLTRALNRRGAEVEAMHGDKDQKEREVTLERFKSGKVKVIIATDVMARGIDVDNISHIVNYDVPNDADDYIHRIGRTARADSTGDAITFVSPSDMRKMKDIFRLVDSYIPVLDVPDEVINSRGGNQQQSSRNTDRDDQREDRRPNRPPRRNEVGQQEKSPATEQSDSKATQTPDEQPKPRPKRKPAKRKPATRKKDNAAVSDTNKKPKPKNKPKAKNDKPVTPREKYIRKQEKLIEQVQQSTMPLPEEMKEKKPEKGLWGKLKNVFKK